jgi:hypothetical protein
MDKLTLAIEMFNGSVRGICTLGLTGGFIYGFVVSKVVSVDAYIGVFGAVVAWWFASRVQATRATDKPNNTTTTGVTP